MTISEQIKALEKSLAEATAKQTALATKSGEAGRTFEDAERQEFDSLAAQIKATRGDIERLKALELEDIKTAKPIDKSSSMPTEPRNTQKLEPGIAFARAVRCIGLGAMQRRNATDIAKSLYGDRPEIVAATDQLMTKTAVTAATTSNSTWAGALVNGQPAADFIDFLMPTTILGALKLRAVPFRQPIISQDSIGTAAWVAEGNPIPATSASFSKKSMEPLKVAALAIASMETLRDSSPAADALIRDSLAEALRFRLDTDFISKSNAGTANTKPAAITNGVTGHTASGTTVDAVRADLKLLFEDFAAQNRNVSTCAFVMAPSTALALSLMTTDLGVPFFAGMGLTGGSLMGLPVIASQYVPKDNATGDATYPLYLIDQQNVYYNAGALEVDMSTEASVEMNDAPTGGATSLVSLWQNDLVGFRAVMSANWAQRRTGSVAAINGTNYA